MFLKPPYISFNNKASTTEDNNTQNNSLVFQSMIIDAHDDNTRPEDEFDGFNQSNNDDCNNIEIENKIGFGIEDVYSNIDDPESNNEENNIDIEIFDIHKKEISNKENIIDNIDLSKNTDMIISYTLPLNNFNNKKTESDYIEHYDDVSHIPTHINDILSNQPNTNLEGNNDLDNKVINSKKITNDNKDILYYRPRIELEGNSNLNNEIISSEKIMNDKENIQNLNFFTIENNRSYQENDNTSIIDIHKENSNNKDHNYYEEIFPDLNNNSTKDNISLNETSFIAFNPNDDFQSKNKSIKSLLSLVTKYQNLGKNEFNINLYPKKLGHMNVKLKTDNIGNLNRIIFTVNNNVAYDAVNSSIDFLDTEITQIYNNAGQTTNVQIDLEMGQSNQKQYNKDNTETILQEFKLSSTNSKHNTNTRTQIALHSKGILDIKV